ncbi:MULTISPECIES: VRR-NUC domain-containing protein [Polaromonas]|uniref:VRR-NUC domain-containing protein n=1 Tax=Polaromonas aquatica TaxID=332657 RepID=A0ABW1TUZ6_9BURK
MSNTRHTALARIPDRMSAASYLDLVAKGAITQSGTSASDKTSKGATRASPEEDLHRSCFEWVELLTPRHPILKYLVHVPNGGARSKGEAGKLKAMGTRPGIPDFVLPRARGCWRGMAIELKSDTGRLSDDQKFWLQGLEAEDYLVSVCRSLDDFQTLVLAFLNGQATPACVERGWDASNVEPKRLGMSYQSEGKDAQHG